MFQKSLIATKVVTSIFNGQTMRKKISPTHKNLTSIKVLEYLEDPNTNLESLHRYPKIKNVFLKFNKSLTLSAPVERLFSFASIILQKRRG